MNDPKPKQQGSSKSGPLRKTSAQMVLVPNAGDMDVATKKVKKASKMATKHVYKTPEKGRGGSTACGGVAKKGKKSGGGVGK